MKYKNSSLDERKSYIKYFYELYTSFKSIEKNQKIVLSLNPQNKQLIRDINAFMKSKEILALTSKNSIIYEFFKRYKIYIFQLIAQDSQLKLSGLFDSDIKNFQSKSNFSQNNGDLTLSEK